MAHEVERVAEVAAKGGHEAQETSGLAVLVEGDGQQELLALAGALLAERHCETPLGVLPPPPLADGVESVEERG